MEDRYGIRTAITENRTYIRTFKQETFNDYNEALEIFNEYKMRILENIDELIIDRSNQHIKWDIRLMDHKEGIVFESFCLYFNQNFNKYAD
jgi:hypothetical protein